jgi:hypothetical protein
LNEVVEVAAMHARSLLGSGLAAAVALAVAAPAGANPPSHAVYVPSAPMRVYRPLKPDTNVVHVSKPVIQSSTHFPVYFPIVLPSFGAGLFGALPYSGSFGQGAGSCASQQPRTLGELAPGGDASFAPVTQSMLPAQSGGGAFGSLLNAIVGMPVSAPSSPLLPQGPDTQSLGLQSLSAQCASQALMPSFDLQNEDDAP